MPIAFGSNTGGLLMLTGTPPNIIARNALAENGFEAFSFLLEYLLIIPNSLGMGSNPIQTE